MSALAMAATGAILLFLPVEVARIVGWRSEAELPLQLAAAGLLGFAVLNWIGRSAIYGGIYGRPIVLANFTFGVVGGGAFVSSMLDGALPPWGWVPTALLVSQALAFWRLMRGAPWVEDQGSKRDSGSGATD